MAALKQDFEALGLGGRDWPEAWVGACAGQRGLVVASAACVWDDLASIGIDHVRATGDFGWTVVAVNDMIMHFPGIVHHAYSNQHRWLPHWLGARRETISGFVTRHKWGGVGTTHTNGGGAQVSWPWPGHGTSTLNAVWTALALGLEPVVICGAPLDDSPHYFEPPWARCNFAREIGTDVTGKMMYWERSRDRVFKGRVRAQSGRTRELLGAYRA